MKTTLNPVLRTDLRTSREERRIDLVVYCNGKQTKLSTSYFAKPSEWDKKQHCVLPSHPQALMINTFLARKKADFQKYLWEKELNETLETISIKEISSLLKDEVKDSLGKDDDTPLEEIFDLYLEKLTGEKAQPNTIRNYKSHKAVICRYAYEKYGKKVNISDINLTFAVGLRKYLQEERGNDDGAVGKRMEGFRAVIRWAIHNGYKIDNPFSQYNKLIPAGQSKVIYLNDSEYKKFKTVTLPKNASHSLRLSLLAFIFSCETGLRYSDMQDLKWEHLRKNGKIYTALSKIQVKNRNYVEVALSPLANGMIKTQEHNLGNEYVFDRITGQTINKSLKVLAGMVRIEKDLTFHMRRHHNFSFYLITRRLQECFF